MKLVVLGDSHVTALGAAASADPRRYARKGFDGVLIGKLAQFPQLLEPFHSTKEDSVRFNNAKMGLSLKDLTGQPFIQSGDQVTYVFSGAFTTTVFVSLQAWKQFTPWSAPVSGRIPVSEGVVKQVALDHFQHIIAFLQSLAELGLNVAAVEAPPPRRDLPAVRKTGADVVLELDRLAREAVRDALIERGVGVIDSPPEAYQNESGRRTFLKEELSKAEGDDFHHANVRFGELMMPALIKAAKDLGRRVRPRSPAR